MKRVATAFDQGENSVKAPLAAAELEGCARDEPEGAQTGYERKIKLFVFFVVGEIQEGVLFLAAAGRHQSDSVSASAPRL